MEATIFAVLVAAAMQSTYATTYIVGDSIGWIRPADSEFYYDWAYNKTFFVHDVLLFKFITGEDDVAEVTETVYDTCTTNDRIHHYEKSPVSITLKDPKDYYFLCTFSDHCAGGQKLHVQVLNSTANTDILGSVSTLVPTLYLVLFISIFLLLLF
ncbi:Plastocyanin-like protein [Corchorus olitorius]|uniref:Plastocyanin-like protein n=1 Tax=Corchorus olitorius TaxID=93759 RepID=A0A1R3GIB4_9ROSI|nr:Plastocyanin-like protein [Corchorus olitorius]